MNTQSKEELLDIFCAMINCMLSCDLIHPAFVLSQYLKDFSVMEPIKQRLEDTCADVKTMMQIHKLDYEQQDVMPPQCSKEEEKLLWLCAQGVCNLFAAGNFAMGYVFLMDFAQVWSAVYTLCVQQLSRMECKDLIEQWAVLHLLFAADISKKKHFEMEGLKVSVDPGNP